MWLASDPANATAFDAVNGVWDLAGAVRPEAVGFKTGRRSLVQRIALLGSLAMVLIAGGTFGVWEAAFAGVYETGVGEQKRVTLEDGSQLLLDTDTSLRVSFDKRLREVSLRRGQVWVKVAAGSDRPFVVEAAGRKIVASHSTMNVRRDADRVSVVLLQGQALVEDHGTASTAAHDGVLNAGQRLLSDDVRADKVDSPDVDSLIAWQAGHAVFDHAFLADAVREMNRYSEVSLKISDARLATLQISGVYRVGDNRAFAHSVAELLHVNVRISGDQVELFGGPAQDLSGRAMR